MKPNTNNKNSLLLFLYKKIHLMERYIMKSIVVHLGNFPMELSSTGVYTLICLMWVSLPFWWLAKTAIWIIKVRIGFLWESVKGTWIQPLGSTNSSCWKTEDKKEMFTNHFTTIKYKSQYIYIKIASQRVLSAKLCYIFKSTWSNAVQCIRLNCWWYEWVEL